MLESLVPDLRYLTLVMHQDSGQGHPPLGVLLQQVEPVLFLKRCRGFVTYHCYSLPCSTFSLIPTNWLKIGCRVGQICLYVQSYSRHWFNWWVRPNPDWNTDTGLHVSLTFAGLTEFNTCPHKCVLMEWSLITIHKCLLLDCQCAQNLQKFYSMYFLKSRYHGQQQNCSHYSWEKRGKKKLTKEYGNPLFKNTEQHLKKADKINWIRWHLQHTFILALLSTQ